MLLPELQLSTDEKKKLLQKHQRQFLINSLVLLKNTGSLRMVLKAYKKAGVGIKEIWNGILD